MTKNLPVQHSKRVSAFLETKVRAARGRITFVIDATMSRQETWDAAAQLQAEMFSEAARLGGLEMQVVHFRGTDEVGASAWTSDARELQQTMTSIRCQSGYTKFVRAFAHVRKEHTRQALNAVIVIGDALEEEPGTLYDAVAGLGAPFFMFQERADSEVCQAFKEVARLTKGAYCTFDTGAIAQLRELLRAVAAFAVGGLTALTDQRSSAARKLLEQLK
jgi:hypothetical protein